MCAGGRLAQTGPLWPVHLQEFSRASVQPAVEESLAEREPARFWSLSLSLSAWTVSFSLSSFCVFTLPRGDRRFKQWKNEVTCTFSVLFLRRKKEKRGNSFCSWCVLNKTRRRGQDKRPHMAATAAEREAPHAERQRWSFRHREKSRFTNWPVWITPLNLSSLHRAGFGSQLWGREREERGQNQDRQAWRFYQVKRKMAGFMCFISRLLKRNSFIRNWRLGSTLESSATFLCGPNSTTKCVWILIKDGVRH